MQKPQARVINDCVTPFFDSQWKENIADLVFTVPIRETGECADIVFLLEHKSFQDPKTLKQLLRITKPIIFVLANIWNMKEADIDNLVKLCWGWVYPPRQKEIQRLPMGRFRSGKDLPD